MADVGYVMPARSIEGAWWGKLGSSGGRYGVVRASVHGSACFAGVPYFCPASPLTNNLSPLRSHPFFTLAPEYYTLP
jgi:hypothetical protein